jgi:hypothetical protein
MIKARREGSKVMIREGEKLRNNINGRVYQVKAIRNSLVVLDAVGDSSWIITEKDILKMFYKRLGRESQRNDRPFSAFPSTTPKGA